MFVASCNLALERQWLLEFHASIRFDLSAELWDFGPKIENVRPKKPPKNGDVMGQTRGKPYAAYCLKTTEKSQFL